MAEVAVDFGTSNTVLARFNESTGRPETIEIPAVSTRMRYRITPGGQEHAVWVTPSVIHYSDTETLIGDQVMSRGLAEHPTTFRWMKRSIAAGSSKKRKTAQGFKSIVEAGEEFLSTLLLYASDWLSLTEDSFTFTAPVEAFENYQDWLMRVCEKVGIHRVRLLDEPTAAVFGVHGATRKDERFLVFDFGGGTLDVSAVRIDLAVHDDRKAVQLGQGGRELGGMNIDLWLAEDFCARHGLDDHEKRELEAVILRQAEGAKMALSDPATTDAEMLVLNRCNGAPRLHRTLYQRDCFECRRHSPIKVESADACLGCLLQKKRFLQDVDATLELALENAALKAQMRRADLTRVVVTGGTSLIPCVREYLENKFSGKVEYDHPFDTVVRGGCRGIVEPILRHDYAIESYNPATKQYVFQPLFSAGDEYPTTPGRVIKFWSKGSTDGQTRVGLKVFEVSQGQRPPLEVGLVDREGALRGDSRVSTDRSYLCLNPTNPTFILADPPISLNRDQRRFLTSFRVDGNRRLLVTVLDQLGNKVILNDYPMVRL